FHDMPAEHGDNAALLSRSVHYCVDDRSKISRGENVGERGDERVERAVVTWRMRELAGAHFVRPPRDRNGPNGGEISLGRQFGAGPGTRFSGTLVVGEGRYDLR